MCHMRIKETSLSVLLLLPDIVGGRLMTAEYLRVKDSNRASNSFLFSFFCCFFASSLLFLNNGDSDLKGS